MTRDYAKKNRRRAPAKKSQVPGWVWLFTGCVLGAFVMFLIYLWELPEPSEEPRTASAPAEAQPQPAAEPEQPSRPKPRFDFYKLLRDSEEIVPATAPEQPQRSTRGQPQESAPSSPAERVEYILQVGSFRNPVDADRLRAELLLLNLSAYTEQVNIRDGELWHRVLVGPFDNQSRLASARNTLVSNEFNALVLKRTPE